MASFQAKPLRHNHLALKRFCMVLALSIFINTNARALEITNYTASITGVFHNVTVAFEDLENKHAVRCVIKRGGKPVGMKTQVINGVGTIEIIIAGGVNFATATCVALQ